MKVSDFSLKKTKAGGAMIGKRDGQTIIHQEGTLGGYLTGKLHKEGGIKATVKSDGSPLEMQGGEVVITAPAVASTEKYQFEGREMTPREILSAINVDGGGIAFAESGLEIPKSIKVPEKSYHYRGKQLSAGAILNKAARGEMTPIGPARYSALMRAMELLEKTPLNENYDRLKENPEKAIKFIADQALGRYETGEISHIPGTYEGAVSVFGPQLVELSVLAYPLDTPQKEKGGTLIPQDQYHKNGAHDRALVIIASEPVSETTTLYKEFKKGGFVPSYAAGGRLNEKPLELSDIPAIVKRFMPKMQQRAIVGSMEHEEVLNRLKKILDEMPSTYQTEDIPTEDKIVYLHYFYGSSDWYIVEKDKLPEQEQAFGYAVLNQDTENAEWGYINIEELKQTNKVELDFYFTPIKFGELFPSEEKEEEKSKSDRQKGTFGYGKSWGIPEDYSEQLLSALEKLGFIITSEKKGIIDIIDYGHKMYVNDNGGEFNLGDRETGEHISNIPYTAWKSPVNFIKLAYQIQNDFLVYYNLVPDYIYVGGRFNSLDYVKFDDSAKADEWLKKTGLGKKDIHDPNGYEPTRIEGDYASDYMPEGVYAWKGKPGTYLTRGVFESALSHLPEDKKPEVSIVSETVTYPFQTEEDLKDIDETWDEEKGIIYFAIFLHFYEQYFKKLFDINYINKENNTRKISFKFNDGSEGVIDFNRNLTVENYNPPAHDKLYDIKNLLVTLYNDPNKERRENLVIDEMDKLFAKKDPNSNYRNGRMFKKIFLDFYGKGIQKLFKIDSYHIKDFELFINFTNGESGVIDLSNMTKIYDYSSDDAFYNLVTLTKFLFTSSYKDDDEIASMLERMIRDETPVSIKEPEPGKKPSPAPVVKNPAIPVATNKREQANINTQIKDLIRAKGTDVSLYSADDIALLKLYEGAGGLAAQGATGKDLFWQFFTPMEICNKMWGLAFKYGFTFNNTNILEPAYGSARFLQFIPQEAKVYVRGYEIEETAYTIGKVLFPKYDLRFSSFETMFFTGRRHVGLAGVDVFFDLVIGNPPYAEYVSNYAKLGEKDDTGAFTFEMYFIMRGVDVLKPGGLLVFIIPSSFMANNKKYNDFKEKLARKVDLLEAYRLPSGIFPNTEVTTDIIVLRKK